MKIKIHSNPFENVITNGMRENNHNFNNLVLEHIKKNKPEGTLEQLLNEMKELSPDATVTMQSLNSALLYSDASLRTDPDYNDYTTEILDNRTNQLLVLNMLTDAMLNKMSLFYDEDNNLTLVSI